MRDLLVLAIVFGSLPFCVFRPFVGVIMWVWLGYMNPHRLSWGLAQQLPLSQLVAVATLIGIIGYILTEKRLTPLRQGENFFFVLLWCQFTLTSFFAFNPETVWYFWERTTKILVFTLVTIVVISDREKLRYFLLAIVLSVGFFGLKGGIWTILTAGQNKLYGPEGSFLADNNALAVAFNMILPVVVYLAKEEQNWKIRYGLLGIFFFSIFAIIGTYSRGGFLGLCAVLVFLALNSKHKVGFLSAIIVVSLTAAMVIPSKYYERVGSIRDAHEQDTSAIQRLHAWYFCLQLALDRPLIGGGFEPQSEFTYRLYAPEYIKKAKLSAHSSYFQILGDHGFVGLALFLGLLFISLWNCKQIEKTARGDPSREWQSNYAKGLRISLTAFMVSGAFVNLGYFDLMYHIIAAVIILKSIAMFKPIEDRKHRSDSAEAFAGNNPQKMQVAS